MGKLYSFPTDCTTPDPAPSEPAPVLLALDVARAALVEVGADRVELVTAAGSGRVTIQPARLDDGESIGRALGLNSPLDQRMVEPGSTLWCGARDGFEFEVRGTLRQLNGGIQ